MNRISDLTGECFNGIAQLRAADAVLLPPPEAISSRLRALIDEVLHRGAEAGLSREDTQDVAYALVALADETLLSKPDERIRSYWSLQPLQLHYFRENVAGEAFFRRLEALRKDPRRKEVLLVYYLALLFGFQGKYRVQGAELELMNLTEAVHGELLRGRGREVEALSPSGERPVERVQGGREPRSVAVYVGAAALALTVVVYVALRWSLGASAAEVIDSLTALAAPRG